jgi:hypothetical protein
MVVRIHQGQLDLAFLVRWLVKSSPVNAPKVSIAGEGPVRCGDRHLASV